MRKLNQAYFAFYGAYDDEPGGGAAGHDPVGPAVRELRMQSPSLQSFLRRIARLTSYEDLQELLALEEEAGFEIFIDGCQQLRFATAGTASLNLVCIQEDACYKHLSVILGIPYNQKS